MDTFSLDQKRLIASLNEKLKPKLTTQLDRKIPIKYMSGFGSLADNLKMVNQYICSCGAKFESISHSTKKTNSDRAFDSYHLHCNSCGHEEKINFRVLKKTLIEGSEIPQTIQFSRLYPYLE